MDVEEPAASGFFYVIRIVAVEIHRHFIAIKIQGNKKATRESDLSACIY